MKLKIGTKIMAGYIIILIFLAVATFFAYKGMESVETSYNKITDVNLPTIVSIWEAQYYEQELRGLTRAYLLYADAKYEKEFYNTDKEFKDQISELEKLGQTEESKKYITQLLEHHNNYFREATTIINYLKSGQREKAMAHSAVALPYAEAFDKTAREFSANADKAVGGWVAQAQSKAASTQLESVIIAVLAAILGIGIGIYLTRSISKPVIALTGVAKELANGDLTKPVPEIKTGDEIQELGKSFATMVTNLRQILGKVNEASLQVASTAEEMSSSSEQNSSAAQQIAKAIEELAKGNTEQTKIVNDAVNIVEQMTKSIDSIAAGAQEQARNVTVTSEQAAKVAKQVQEVAQRTEGVKDASVQNLEAAQKGGLAVNKAIAGMEKIQVAVTDSGNKITELGKQSQQIGEIIQVIDDIAEQTNLLALNAAIEAARAGEHGKGFAVVADEVRKLAERSGKATKEIATLITSIQKGTEIAVKSMEIGTKEVSSGVEIAREAGDALNEILDIVEKSSAEVEAIALAFKNITTSTDEVSKAAENVAAITEENTAATEEMAAGSGQVNSSIVNIAAIAEQSAASAEEVSASTEEMNASTEEITASAQNLANMAQDLQQLLAQFKV